MKKTQGENRKPPRPVTLDLYTVAETAAILDVSQKTVFEWIRNGNLAATRLGPGQRLIRIRRTDLEQFVETDFGEGQTRKAREQPRSGGKP
jgi:excisionase family DNA binding protein